MVDRISNLPDEVLCHILSFLPTEDAYVTRFLSKRWKPLWISVPTLDFDDQRSTSFLRSHTSFIQFVYTCILRRDTHQSIKTLRLQCNRCSILHVEIWLKAAMKAKVENLEINMYSKQYLPCTIFNITTLVVLKLKNVPLDDISSVHLPSLKAMHLDNVRFLKPQHFMELLNGCPVLEKLEAKHITFAFNDDPSSKGKFKSLSKLARANVSNMMINFHIPVRTFCNVQFLRLDKLCDVDFPMFPNLIHMELILGVNLTWESVLDMLNHCPQLRTLLVENLCSAAHQVWPNTHAVSDHFPSQLRTCMLTDFTGMRCEMRFVKFVMQNSTLLQTMRIFCEPYLEEKYVILRDVASFTRSKYEILRDVASFPRSSAACELLFM